MAKVKAMMKAIEMEKVAETQTEESIMTSATQNTGTELASETEIIRDVTPPEDPAVKGSTPTAPANGATPGAPPPPAQLAPKRSKEELTADAMLAMAAGDFGKAAGIMQSIVKMDAENKMAAFIALESEASGVFLAALEPLIDRFRQMGVNEIKIVVADAVTALPKCRLITAVPQRVERPKVAGQTAAAHTGKKADGTSRVSMVVWTMYRQDVGSAEACTKLGIDKSVGTSVSDWFSERRNHGHLDWRKIGREAVTPDALAEALGGSPLSLDEHCSLR